MVGIERLTDEDKIVVQQLIYKHLEATESARAKEILGDWPKFAASFWKVKPKAAAPKTAEVKPASVPAVSKKAAVANP